MGKAITDTVGKIIERLPPHWVVLLETNAEHTISTSVETVKYLVDKGMHGIIVSVSQPYSTLQEHYANQDIDISALNVVDCVTKKETSKPENIDNVVYVQNPSALTDMSIKIKELIKQRKDDGKDVFVLVDSIDSLLIHNNPETVTRFLHGMMTKVRVAKVSAMIIEVAGQVESEVRSKVLQLCDKVISL